MKKNGFTLVELLSTIVILAIIVGIAIPVYFNISKNAKENEYSSKKSYLESLAVRYAEENNISSATMVSVSRLVASGYTSAENYVGDSSMPFISNPVDSEDNLACRVVSLSVENYEFKASISEQSDCSFAESDLVDSLMGIKLYEFEDNKIGNQIAINSDSTVNWTNKDVLVVVNPGYENVKSLTMSTSGDSHLVDFGHMLVPDSITKGTSINLNAWSNVLVVGADRIAKQTVNVAIELDDTIKSSSIEVKIDKESPSVDVQKFSGWTSEKKGATIYLSDGAGSGSKGLYVSETDNFDARDKNLKNVIVDENGLSDEAFSITEVNGNKIKNQRYYLWAVDNAGNVSSTSSYIDIENIDGEDPKVDSLTIKSEKDYPSIFIRATLTGNDGNGSGITYACITTNSSSASCDWQPFGNGSYSKSIQLPGNEGNGNTFLIYGYVRDAVGNVSKSTFKAQSYQVYRRCSQTADSGFSQCSAVCDGGTQVRVITDRYLGSICENITRECNTQRCCGSLIAKEWSSCSKACKGGTQTREYVSAYDGRTCQRESRACNQTIDCCSSTNATSWSSCSAACGQNGIQTRKLTSKYTGESCGTETQACNRNVGCCDKLTYGAWGGCSVNCGTGTQTRPKYSAYNGQSCGTESATCTKPDCCSSVSYGAWSACGGALCGLGTQSRAVVSNYNGGSCGTQSQACDTGIACCTKTWHSIKTVSDNDSSWSAGSQKSAKEQAVAKIEKALGMNVSVSCSESCSKTTWNSDDTRTKKCTVSAQSGDYKVSGTFYIMMDTNKAGDCKAKVKDRYAYVNLSATKYQYKC